MYQQTPQHDTSQQPRLEKQTPPRPSTEPDFKIPPAGIYSEHGTVWWERKFPCPGCGAPANGAPQCVRCFAHVHENCGIIGEGSCHGIGKTLYCGVCDETDDCTSQTQEWQHDEEERGLEQPDKPEVRVGGPDPEEKTQYVWKLHSFLHPSVMGAKKIERRRVCHLEKNNCWQIGRPDG